MGRIPPHPFYSLAMKSFLLFILLLLCACSTDIHIMEEHDPVPVVWAILDPYDSVQYVRVQRTFLIREKADWETLNRDSLEFKDVEVFLYGKKDGEIKWVEQFVETTMEKKDGFFPTGDYQVFMIDHPLPITVKGASQWDGGLPDLDSLYLEVRIRDIGRVITAGAPCMRPGRINLTPLGSMFYLYQEFSTKFGFEGGACGECGGLNPGELCYRQIEFWVHIKEHYEGHVESKTLNWRTTSGYAESGWYYLTPERLFNPMKQQVSDDPLVVARTLDSIDVEMKVPSRAFHLYYNFREFWGQTEKSYSNFDYGYGIFSTFRRHRITGYVLERRAMDSLCYGYWNKEMKFRYW